MKKLLLLLMSILGVVASAQSLSTESFNGLTAGNISTNITGASAGQGGWYLFSTNGTAPTTSTNASVTSAQIVSSALQLTGPNGDKGATYVWKADLPAAWTARTSGNNIIEVEVDVTRGANAAVSQNRFGVYIYNSDGLKTLAGFTVNASTGEINLIAYSTPPGYSIGNYSYPLAAAPGLIFPANTTARMGISFNKTTGQVIIKGPGIAAAGLVLVGSATGTDPVEVDFLCFAGGTTTAPNTASATMIFDNLTVKASATDTLLGLADNNVATTKFSVSPNPTTGLINVTNNEGINVNEITVTDLNGRVVKTTKFDNVSNIEMNISDLSSGMYMMSIKSDAGTATKKIVKN